MVLWAALWGWGHFEWPCLKGDNPTINSLSGHVFPPPYVCACLSLSHSFITSLSLRHHTVEPLCKRQISCNQRQITGRLTGGPEVGQASAEIHAAGRNKARLTVFPFGLVGSGGRKTESQVSAGKELSRHVDTGDRKAGTSAWEPGEGQAVSCLAKKFPQFNGAGFPTQVSSLCTRSFHPLHPPRGGSPPPPWEPLTTKPGKESERESASPSGSFHRLPTVSLLSGRGQRKKEMGEI